MSAPARIEIDCSCQGPIVEVHAADPSSLQERARCESCGAERELHRERVDAKGGLLGCVACGHPELFTTKDFPRALGLGIVVVAAVLAPFTWYISLFVAAGLDFAIYHLAPEVRHCYVCEARHRGFANEPRHPRYDPTIPERLRFGDKAVMGSPMREGGTAGAPDPEH